MLSESTLIFPDWPAPANVKAFQTTRAGGVSSPPYASLNLGTHVADDPLKVAANRQLLNRFVPTEPIWLNQVHGTQVVDAARASCVPDADAAFSRVAGSVCVTMTADCLPVLLCDEQGTVVAAAHAGWRGLCDGVIEATVAAMQTKPEYLMAWLGPAIGPQAFEVGGEVRSAFMQHDVDASTAFIPAQGDDKWMGDVFLLAMQRLNKLGITRIFGGGLCTHTDSKRFFSFRRDGATGRMATMIWLEHL